MYRGNALVNQQNPKTVYSADTLPQIQFQVHEFIINKQCKYATDLLENMALFYQIMNITSKLLTQYSGCTYPWQRIKTKSSDQIS